MIHFNGHDISSIYYGTREIKKVYQGTRLVWQKPSQSVTGPANAEISASRAFSVILSGQTVSIPAGTDTQVYLPPASGEEAAYLFANNSGIIDVFTQKEWDLSGVNSLYGLCNGSHNLKNAWVYNSIYHNVVQYGGMFANCTALESVNVITDMDYPISGFNDVFKNSSHLSCINYNINLGNVNTLSNTFLGCTSLTEIHGGWSNLRASVDLSDCPLTNDSAMKLIDATVSVSSTKTLTFKASTYSTLTSSQIATATSKGWSVVSA